MEWRQWISKIRAWFIKHYMKGMIITPEFSGGRLIRVNLEQKNYNLSVNLDVEGKVLDFDFEYFGGIPKELPYP